jgi:long-chain acyl-CoA synthetase
MDDGLSETAARRFGPGASLRTLVVGLAQGGARPAILEIKGESATATSYAELGARALALASALPGLGIEPGAPVILFGPNSADWITVRLGLAAFGVVAVALDDLSSEAELAVLIPDSGARVAFVAARHIECVRRVAPALALVRLDAGAPQFPHWAEFTARPSALPNIRPEQAQMIVYTSGTTGQPKSFELSHANILHNVAALLGKRAICESDSVLLPLPLHHVYPLTVGLLTTLASRATLVLPEAVQGRELLNAIRHGNVTAIVGVPRLHAALAEGIENRARARGAFAHRIFRMLRAISLGLRRRGVSAGRVLLGSVHRAIGPNLRLLVSGGARFEAELVWRLEALGWDVRSGWGLAEAASILSGNDGGRGKRIGSEGRALEGIEIRVAGPDAQGVGELQARGPSLFPGYRNARAGDPHPFTADGWFATGDLGTIDEAGFITITGRTKEMIVLGGGKNIFPEELEKVYAASPFIAEIAVLEQAGSLHALVRPNEAAIVRGGARNVEAALRVALTEAAQKLAPFQRLAGYAIAPEPLPRTRLGKVRRFALPELYAAARSGHRRPREAAPSEADRALLAQPLARSIYELLSAGQAPRRIELDDSLALDLGIDSLGWVTLGLELSERFGIGFEEADASTILTVRDLLHASLQRQGKVQAIAPNELTPEDLHWLAPRRPHERIVGQALFGLDWLLAHGLFRLAVLGREHVPRSGPFVIACNHLSDLDPLLLAAALGLDRLAELRWGAERGRLFHLRAGRAIARAARLFPVEERAPAKTLAIADRVLAAGEALVWFPESWRSPDGRLQAFQPGIGYILRARPVPVVPAFIHGTFEAMPRGASLPRPSKVRIRFGPVLGPQDFAGLDTPQAVADRVREAVAHLGDPGESER